MRHSSASRAAAIGRPWRDRRSAALCSTTSALVTLTVMEERLLQLLSNVWGYQAFRDPQLHVVKGALDGHDSLVVMSTGAGKSICYQLPALHSNRTCVVVSPLISLMQDQVHALTARNIPAAFLGSAQTSGQVKQDAWAGHYLMLYVTPELLVNSPDLLRQLHAARGIALVAIDEAHCVSEWGHDFRPSYRQLGLVRQVLPDVPIMALTATATPRVQQDIVNQLHLGQGKPLQRWVMGFDRANLHLSVRQKPATAAACFQPLVAEAKQQHANRRQLPPTLVYVQSTKQADELQALLSASGITAVKYHSKMANGERGAAHQAFHRDDAEVMVATVAFGMGIDKPNIRTIIHYGVPSSLEAYYQQAGRAGRDGMPSRCCLMWAPKDFQLLDLLNDMDGHQPGPHQEEQRAGVLSYVNSSTCRHAQLVNHFAPGSQDPAGPCCGGCDACERRAGGAQATDVSADAALLLAAVRGLKGLFGLGRPVALLRGSRSKDIAPWMTDLRAPAAAAGAAQPLHGAGSKRSDGWWKGLGGLLQAQGLLRSEYKRSGHGQMGYSVVAITPQGLDFINAYEARARQQQQQQQDAQQCAAGLSDQLPRGAGGGGPAAGVLRLVLPADMEAEDAQARRQQAAAAAREEQRAAAAQKLTEEAAEKDELREALRAARKQVADDLGQAPDVLVNEATLAALAELRPADAQQLRGVSGMGDAAVQCYGRALLQVIDSFCAAAKHLKPNSGWRQASRSGGASAAAAAAVLPPPGAVDPELLQACQAARVLAEPKGAALEAHQRWAAGETPQQIADLRAKPIQVASVLGYLADACAHGHGTQQLSLLQQQAGLGGGGGPEQQQQQDGQELLVQVQRALAVHLQRGLNAVKKAAPEAATYGQIKVVAAMMAAGLLPRHPLPDHPPAASPAPAGAGAAGSAGAAATPSGPKPSRPVHHSAATRPLLSAPSASALQLCMAWSEGVPLVHVGRAAQGVDLPPSSVLSYLADALGAGHEVDPGLLVVDAGLTEAGAQQLALCISEHGAAGLHAVLHAAPQGTSIARIKVVAALMATRSLWFAGPAGEQQQQQPQWPQQQCVAGLDQQSAGCNVQGPLPHGAAQQGDAAAAVLPPAATGDLPSGPVGHYGCAAGSSAAPGGSCSHGSCPRETAASGAGAAPAAAMGVQGISSCQPLPTRTPQHSATAAAAAPPSDAAAHAVPQEAPGSLVGWRQRRSSIASTTTTSSSSLSAWQPDHPPVQLQAWQPPQPPQQQQQQAWQPLQPPQQQQQAWQPLQPPQQQQQQQHPQPAVLSAGAPVTVSKRTAPASLNILWGGRAKRPA